MEASPYTFKPSRMAGQMLCKKLSQQIETYVHIHGGVSGCNYFNTNFGDKSSYSSTDLLFSTSKETRLPQTSLAVNLDWVSRKKVETAPAKKKCETTKEKLNSPSEK